MNREEIVDAMTEGMRVGYRFDTIVMSQDMHNTLTDGNPADTYMGLKVIIDNGCPDDQVCLLQRGLVVVDGSRKGRKS